MDREISIRIGGTAGQGVESSGAGFCQALARAGLHIFATQDYRSRIRGGHNFYQIRAATHPVAAQRSPPDLLVALTAETIDLHIGQLTTGAGVIYEESLRIEERLRYRIDVEERGPGDLSLMPMPLMKIAADHGSRVMMNTAAMGAVAGVTGFPLHRLTEVIRENFSGKGEAVVEANLGVAEAAHRVAEERHGGSALRIPRGDDQRRMLIHGNHAFALGAVAGGCRFVAAYPMTPATSIIEFLAGISADHGIVTKHAEDEIAAVCMALGAAHVGARAMTATSGGGFSLMTEALGLAGMTETPLVVVDVQRGGPSTGLPTRTEQSDLLFALHASQGEFPRVVFAPGTVGECFEAGWRAFNLAEAYQCPVIVLSDLYLAGSLQTFEPETFDFEDVPINRGALLLPGENAGDTAHDQNRVEILDREAVAPHPWEAGTYPRFLISESGISPRPVPGDPDAIFTAPSDEHSEDGHITEEVHTRVRMMGKRMRKEETALNQSVRPPAHFGPEEAEMTLVCWGSTTGAVREAAAELTTAGRATAVLQLQDLWPFPATAVEAALDGAGLTIGVEQNYTGQLAKLVRMMTGRTFDRRILAYDGRPMSPQDILAAMERSLAGEIEVHIEPGEPQLPQETENGSSV